MNTQLSAPQPTHPLGKTALYLGSLLILITTLLVPSIAAGASGAVSLSIRLEVGLADLQRGGLPTDLRGPSGAGQALAGFAPKLRQSLEGRYNPSEIDRIVGSVTEHAIIILDGEAFGRESSGTWLTSDDGGAYSL